MPGGTLPPFFESPVLLLLLLWYLLLRYLLPPLPRTRAHQRRDAIHPLVRGAAGGLARA